jgi:hypothetical protein
VTVRFLLIAEIELDQAMQWYESQAPGLRGAPDRSVVCCAPHLALPRGLASARRRSAPLPERANDPLVLRAVLRAMRERRALDVLYQSMSRPSPMQRVIEPHALAHDGFRWHARAYDRETKDSSVSVLMSRPRQDRRASSTSCCSTAGRSKQYEFGRRTPETKLLQSAGAQPLLESNALRLARGR